MDDKAIIEARKRAEKAVEGMADESLKVKAFEQILGKLLDRLEDKYTTAQSSRGKTSRRHPAAIAAPPSQDTLGGRLLTLRRDGFFRDQRILSDVRDELASRGWHYPLTTLSGAMQKLVRRRDLRRERAKVGNKRIWKYAEP